MMSKHKETKTYGLFEFFLMNGPQKNVKRSKKILSNVGVWTIMDDWIYFRDASWLKLGNIYRSRSRRSTAGIIFHRIHGIGYILPTFSWLISMVGKYARRPIP